jgi:hypothetical protein
VSRTNRQIGLQKEETGLQVPVPLGLVEHVWDHDAPDGTKDRRNSISPAGCVFSETLGRGFGQVAISGSSGRLQSEGYERSAFTGHGDQSAIFGGIKTSGIIRTYSTSTRRIRAASSQLSSSSKGPTPRPVDRRTHLVHPDETDHAPTDFISKQDDGQDGSERDAIVNDDDQEGVFYPSSRVKDGAVRQEKA